FSSLHFLMATKQEISRVFDKFVYDRVEKDFADAILKLEFWKSAEIDTKNNEANEILNELVEFALREPDAILKAFVEIGGQLEGEQRRRLVSALFRETRLWHISYHAKAMLLDKGRRNITIFLGGLYLNSLISIGEIRSSLEELLEYREKSHNSSTATACVLMEKVGKKFALEERSQFATKEAYESRSAFTLLNKAKFGTDGNVREEIDNQVKNQWMYLKDYDAI
ncbi:hypothetical protein PENTCL1PPCAC_26790, partial [Pristionchus entomophagus]